MTRLHPRALALAASLIALAALTLAVASGALAKADQVLLAWFAAWRNPAADAFFRWVTWSGSFYVLGPAVVVGVFLLRRAGRTGAVPGSVLVSQQKQRYNLMPLGGVVAQPA